MHPILSYILHREGCISDHIDIEIRFTSSKISPDDTRRSKSLCMGLIIKGVKVLHSLLGHYICISDPVFFFLFLSFSLFLTLPVALLFSARLLHLSKENMMNAVPRYWATIGDDKSLRCFAKRKIGPLFTCTLSRHSTPGALNN